MLYIENSEAITGYRVRVDRREAFTVVGFTLLVPPSPPDDIIPKFWDEVIADGRLEKLVRAAPVQPWILGLGSWDPECEKRGYRYTICIEQTPGTDLTALAQEYPLFTKQIGASDWMCFETKESDFPGRFWKDNPYAMLKKLGYRFHTGDFSVGLHFDAYPPGFHPQSKPEMEFWITVVK